MYSVLHVETSGFPNREYVIDKMKLKKKQRQQQYKPRFLPRMSYFLQKKTKTTTKSKHTKHK